MLSTIFVLSISLIKWKKVRDVEDNNSYTTEDYLDKSGDISESNTIFIHVNVGVIVQKKLLRGLCPKFAGMSENFAAVWTQDKSSPR